MLTLSSIARDTSLSVNVLLESAKSAGLKTLAPDTPITKDIALKLLPELPPAANKYVTAKLETMQLDAPSQSVGSLKGKARDESGPGKIDLSTLQSTQLLDKVQDKEAEKSLGVKLDKVKARSVASGGWFAKKSTKIHKAQEGFLKETASTLKRLSRPDGKTPSLQGVLEDMKTLQKNLDRQVELKVITRDQMDDLLLAAIRPSVAQLSNTELSSVWQTLCSREVGDLKGLLERRSLATPPHQGARAAYSNMMALEACVLKELSTRIQLAEPSKDISSSNLKALTEVSSQSATNREKNVGKTVETYDARGGEKLDPKKVGDIMRGCELTMNVSIESIFGFGTDVTPAVVDNPNHRVWENAHHLKAKGVAFFTDVYMARRVAIEDSLWPELSGHDVDPNERPTYGALNLHQRLRGAAPPGGYGEIVLVMKPEVKQRCTYTVDDTFFAVRVTVDDTRTKAFFDLAKGMGDKIDPRLALAFADPASPESKALTAWFQQVGKKDRPTANDLNQLGEILKNSNPDAHYEARFGKDKEGDDLRLEALAVEVFGDRETTRDSTATYDNLEALIPHMKTETVDGLVHSSLNGGESGTACLGTNYIEAQIQGALDLSRDVQALRVPLDTLQGWAEQKGKSIDELRNQLQAFGARHGIQIEIMDDERLLEDDTRVGELLDNAKQFSVGQDKVPFDEACQKLLSDPKRIDDLIDKASASLTGKEILPDGVKMIHGATMGRLMQLAQREMEKESTAKGSSGETAQARAEKALLKAAATILNEKQALLDHLKTLKFDNVEQRNAFATWAVSAKALKDPKELQVIYDHSFALRDGLKNLGSGDPLQTLDVLFTSLGQDILKWSSAKGGEFGKDDLITTLSRVTSLAASLLEHTDGVSKEQREALLAKLTTPTMALKNQALELLGVSLLTKNDPEKQRMIGVHEMLSFTALALGKSVGKSEGSVFESLKPRGKAMTDEAQIPPGVRGELAKVYPNSLKLLDDAHPATPVLDAKPLAKPTSLAPLSFEQRRGFLLSVMDPYLARESTFEKGSSTHGRGHVTRAFIFANVMGNILNERGLNVDVGAVSMAISGHDMARKGGGTDVWEKESAKQTRDAMVQTFGQEKLGEEYLKASTKMIEGHEEPFESVEAMLMVASDSLDIGRVTELDPALFPFLRETIRVGDVEVVVDEGLRAQLGVEADLLQRMTNPLCAIRQTLNRLQLEIANPSTSDRDREEMMKTVTTLKEQAAKLFQEEQALGHDAFVAKIESVVHDHPKLFPVLSKYYR